MKQIEMDKLIENYLTINKPEINDKDNNVPNKTGYVAG
jgi:hypothetical protein